MSFGQKLKVWRKAKGMTQEELALAVGVHSSYISNLERDFSANAKSGKPTASEKLAEKLAKVLSVNVDEMRMAAGYAPKNQNEIQIIAKRLASGVMASGFDNLQDEELREAFLEDMQTIAESMLKRRLAEQEKKKGKK